MVYSLKTSKTQIIVIIECNMLKIGNQNVNKNLFTQIVHAFFINQIGLINEKSTSTPNSNATIENKINQLRALLNLVLNQVNNL